MLYVAVADLVASVHINDYQRQTSGKSELGRTWENCAKFECKQNRRVMIYQPKYLITHQ